QSAARPSEKKSSPPTRIHEFHGFVSGSVRVSTSYAAPVFPSTPCVVTVEFHRDGPPFVSGSGSSILSASTACLTTPRSEPKTNFIRIGWSCDGIFIERRDFSWIFHSAFSGIRTQPTTRPPIARPQGKPSESRGLGVSQRNTVSDSDDGPSR